MFSLKKHKQNKKTLACKMNTPRQAFYFKLPLNLYCTSKIMLSVSNLEVCNFIIVVVGKENKVLIEQESYWENLELVFRKIFNSRKFEIKEDTEITIAENIHYSAHHSFAERKDYRRIEGTKVSRC